MRLTTLVVAAIAVSLLAGVLEGTLPGGRSAVVVEAVPLASPRAQTPGFLDQVRRVTVEELRLGLERGTAVAVDVRSERAYRADHIKGALWLFHREAGEHVDRLPRNKTLVLYCT